jgi:hypothetical protein
MATAKIKKYYEDDTLIISDRWFLPSKLSDLADDSTHRTVTDAEKITWNAKEDASNKSNDIATDASSTTKYPSVKAIKDYADSLVIWLTDLRWEYNASVNTFPATWWSGTWWAILKGDVWLISVEWTLWGVLYKVWDAIIAISDTPWQTAWNWGHLNSWLWFVPENVANKVTTFQVTPDDIHYATEKLVKDSLDAKEDSLPVVTTNPDISYLNWNKEWATINVWAWWYWAPLYFTIKNSDVSWYKKIDYVWEMSLTELTWIINNEEKLLRTYLYDYQLDTTVIDAWPWIASFRVKVSNAVWVTKLKLEPFLYHTDTTETTLFSVYSSEINNTTYTVIRNESPQWVYSCVATDRLWVRVYASTTANTNITVSTTVWDGDASYFTTPLAIRHDLLRNKAWTSSWHTGTASTVAWFLASTWVAAEYTLSWTWTVLPTTVSPTFKTPILWTPTSWTLTNCTWLPISWLTASTSTALWVWSIELWHASDTTITRTWAWAIAVEWVAIPTISSTDTLTNKTLWTTQLWEASLKLDATLSADEKWSWITTVWTAWATLAVWDICYLASSWKWLLNDWILDWTDTWFSKQLWICVLSWWDTEPTEMLLYWKIRSAAFPTLTVWSPVYLDDTAGDIVVAQPSTKNFAIRVVWYWITAEDLFFNPDNSYIVHI